MPRESLRRDDVWNARLYDDRHAFVWQFGASLVDLLEPQPGERIVDLGCGTGRLTAEIAERGATVVGIDASAAMIDEARGLFPQLAFQVGDARSFRPAESLDAVFSNAALHWVRPPEAAARTIHDALRPGGRLVAEFGGRGNVRQIVAALESLRPEFFATTPLPNWYFPDVAEYSSVLAAAGLETRSAWLFDRSTPLEGAAGLRHWVQMFAADAVEAVAIERRDEFFATLEESLRPALFVDGRWQADYRRLRITAVRVD